MRAERLRWWIRKAIRGGAGRAVYACGWVAARERLSRQPRVRAVTYHRFGDVPRDPWVVRRADFDAQMEWLASRSLAVSLGDVQEFVAGRKTLVEGAVLVTIDDGCQSTLSEALPVLKRYRVPAVAFVSAGLVGSATAAADHGETYLDWDGLSVLRREGIEIGSHAFDHCALGRLPVDAAREQAVRSRELLEDRLGVAICSFAYPFGTRSDFSAATESMISEAGYEIAFNSLHGAIVPGMPPISLPRVKIEAGEGLSMFQLSCRGAMDPWRLVDDVLGRLRTQRDETTVARSQAPTSERSPERSS